jgi:hypothetical protein
MMETKQNDPTYLNRVELDASLNHIDGGEGSMGDRTTDTSRGSTLEKEHSIIVDLAVSRRGGKEDGTRGHGDKIQGDEYFC